MSALRRVAREAAMRQSYKHAGNTDMFGYFFTKFWREQGHPASENLSPTKPLIARAAVRLKNKLARLARRLNRR